MRRITALAGNAFLLAFALDAGLTVADELGRLAFGSEVLLPARSFAAGIPIALALPLAALLPFAPGLAPAAFLPALAFLAWTRLGAMPFSLWSSDRYPGLVLGAIQVGLALLAFVVVRYRSSSNAWWVRAGDLGAAPFRPLRAIGFLVAAALLVPVALGAYGAFSLAATLESATNGFIRFDLLGVVASEREYTRGDHRVRLVGLMHVGEDEAYRELVASFDEGDLILSEGVSDRDGLLREGLAYENMAQPLGLVVQPSFERALSELEGDDASALSGPRVIHSDVDMRDFSPETLDFLRCVSQVFASGDLATGLSRAHELSKRFDGKAGARILRDLLQRRNDHLVDQLDAALPQHRSIIVPWGALHLPTIERALVERGFERTSEHSRRFVRYTTLLGALTSMRPQAHSLSEGALERE